MLRLANLEALHPGTLGGEGNDALSLMGAAIRYCRSYNGDALHVVMAEEMAPWLMVFASCRWTIAGDQEKFADA